MTIEYSVLLRPRQFALALVTILGLFHWGTRAIASSTLSPIHSPSTNSISQSSATRPDPTWAEGTITLYTLDELNSGHTAPVRAVVFSPDGQFLASTGADKTIKLWNVQTREGIFRTINVDQATREINSLAFSPDGRLLASGSDTGVVNLWDWRRGELVGTLSGHSDVVSSLDFSPDGYVLASGSLDNTIQFWNVSTGEQEQVIEFGQDVTRIAFDPSGTNLAVTGVRGERALSLLSWQQGGRLIHSARYARTIQSLAFSPNGQILAFSPDAQSPQGSIPPDRQQDYNTIHFLNTQNFRQYGISLRGHNDYITDLAFSPSGRQLISTSLDFTIRIWDVQEQQLIRTFQENTRGVLSLAFRPDGRAFAVGNRDATVKLFISNE